MRIEVAFTPALLTHPERKLCVVIDVLRATSTAATMFGRGLQELLVAETVEDARQLASNRPGHLLCGEEHSLAPPGFDHGNSPTEFDALDLSGRRAILATTNGTRALVRAAECPVLLTGALVNLRAVARVALREAAVRDLDVVLLCSGRNGARYFSLEDTFCAGAIVDVMLAHQGERPMLWNGAVAARRLYRSYRGSANVAFREADHGASLIALGLARDLDFCAQRDRFTVVPRLERRADGALALVSGESG
ncbi:MAG: 2-phosphosulfolactate phosphatase [Dehalococcoidia bacterium]